MRLSRDVWWTCLTKHLFSTTLPISTVYAIRRKYSQVCREWRTWFCEHQAICKSPHAIAWCLSPQIIHANFFAWRVYDLAVKSLQHRLLFLS